MIDLAYVQRLPADLLNWLRDVDNLALGISAMERHRFC